MKNFDWNKLKDWFEKLKEKWAALSKRTRVMILMALFVVLSVALTVTIWLNISRMAYRVIFPGMTSGEATEVYATLQDMGVPVQISAGQQVSVPADQWDALVFELNSRGYPKTALSYDTFTSATGFTSTEFEKRVALVYQIQDRVQQTLMRQDGVLDAVVTFYVPETSNFAWDLNNQQKSTANISITMASGKELTAARVSAIKHLAATSVPKLSIEDVVVIDATTGVQLLGLEEQATDADYRERMMELELLMATNMENKVLRLLTPRYGVDGVTVVASVQLDYDKLVTETKEYQPLENGGGGGVRSHYEEAGTRTGSDTAGGLVGEENNTDVPQYPYDNTDGDGNMLSYSRLIDYDNSYILTQLERGQAVKSASIAVIVNDPDFTDEKEDILTSLISKSVNLSADNVAVTNLQVGTSEPADIPTVSRGLTQRQILLLIIIGGVLLLLILILVLVLAARRRKKNAEDEEKRQQALLEEEEKRRKEQARAADEHLRKIKEDAQKSVDPNQSAVVEKVREFAEENPEVAAALIRSMMKEEK